MDNLMFYRIDAILKHIDQVLIDVDGLTADELAQKDLLLRATCFSIAQIGEMMNQLEKSLGGKYWNLPWVGARRMRNLIIHDYGHADVEQVYSTICNDLPHLKTAFLAIRNDLTSNAIITDRLILRKVKASDAAPMFYHWASDKEVTKYVTWLPHENIQVTEALISYWLEQESDPKTIRYMITTKESDEPIGMIDVVDYIDGVPEIGYVLSKKQWNKGYMSEACKAFTEYLLDIGFDKVVIEANVENIASNRVINKCGFTFTHKEHKEHCSVYKPEPIDVYWYEIKR